MKVHEIMHEFPVCCTQWDTALDAARTMKENDVGVLPVVAKNGAGRLPCLATKLLCHTGRSWKIRMSSSTRCAHVWRLKMVSRP